MSRYAVALRNGHHSTNLISVTSSRRHTPTIASSFDFHSYSINIISSLILSQATGMLARLPSFSSIFNFRKMKTRYHNLTN